MDHLRKISQKEVFRHTFKDPFNFYNHILDTTIKISSVSGLDVWKTDYKKTTFPLIFSIVVLFLFFSSNIQAIYETRHKVEDVIYCLVTVGIGLVVMMKNLTHLYFRDKLLGIQEYLKKLIQEETKTHKTVLMDYIEVMNMIAKVVFMGYAGCLVFMLIVPIVFTLLTGHKTLTFGFWLPFIDRFSWPGYICNVVTQIVMCIIVSSEDIGLDTIYFMSVMGSVMQIDLIKDKLQNVNTKFEKGETDVKEDLNEIFKRHYEHIEFVSMIEAVYRSYFFVLFSAFGSSVVLVLYAIITLSWGAGYPSGFFLIYQLFVFCLLPTLLEIKKEELQCQVYNISWYQINFQDQKKIRFMLEAAQQPNSLTMIFYPLNMPTFTVVIKTIYSILTLLLAFRSE